MDASFFIAARLRHKGKIVITCIAVSFLVMIIAVAVASGYRHEVRSAISSVSGDVMITSPYGNTLDSDRPIDKAPAYLPYIEQLDFVESINSVAYRAAIVKHDETMYGIVLKGSPDGVQADSVALAVSLPGGLAEKASIGAGDNMLAYFVGENLKMRRFNVTSVHESLVDADDRHVVLASLADIQRVNGWNENQVSALEIVLDKDRRDEEGIRQATEEIGYLINAYSSEDEVPVIATSVLSRFPQLFSWLDLIDFNVYFILLLMTIVAGFNMISGLLIMLFENISTIGLLKALGMTDRGIAKVFLSSSAVMIGKGMAIGNALALLFCLIQGATHVLKLNPEMYYVSFVPVNVNLWLVLAADAAAFAVIMLLLLIPCLFISKVDPAETVRVS